MDVAFGTLLQRGDGASPTENFATVAEITNVSVSVSRDEIDGSHHQSPGGWRQFKPSLKSAEIAFEANYLPDDPTHDAATGVLSDFDAGVIRNYRILWPETEKKWSAPVFLREFDAEAPVEDKLGLTGTFRVAGEITLE
jgi:predicted secreted protein